MATSHEVLCIKKRDRTSAHERISSIGGKNYDGTRWKLTLDDAIKSIEDQKKTFYVKKNGHTVDVIISTSSLGHKYLKTKNDGDQPDNLLSLPECP
ncbi:DUF3892 domain-containing protein [Fluviicola sp.]|uniref:DUF3892 domain-containing protein n=1 Tax=Fluviicola sp. TaxID=1917219 RepID=UPI003D2979B6